MVLLLLWCAWTITTDTAAFTLARTDPEGALSIDAHSSLALATLAEERLVAAASPAEIGGAVTYAKAALQANPLEERALRVLAFAADLGEDDDGAERLMEAVNERSRRDPPVQAWLFNQAVSHGDVAKALDHADALLRTSPNPNADIYRTLARFVGDAGARSAIAARLEGGPPWRAAFLGVLCRESTDAEAVLSLFNELAAGPRPPTNAELRPFLDSLIGRRNYGLAYLVWVHFLPPDGRKELRYVYNGDFEQPVTQLPFDWIFRDMAGATTEVAAVADPGIGHALHVEFGDTRVPYQNVSKLLMLTPGRYVFQGTVKANGLETERGLVWRIACAEGAKTRIGETPPVKGTFTWRRFTIELDVPEEDCRAQTLTLLLDARAALDQRIAGEVWYDALSVERR